MFRVNIGGHAAAIVQYGHRAVAVQGNFDKAGVAGQRFVNRVIDDFLCQMVGGGVAGYLPRRFPAGARPAKTPNEDGGVWFGHSTLCWAGVAVWSSKENRSE